MSEKRRKNVDKEPTPIPAKKRTPPKPANTNQADGLKTKETSSKNPSDAMQIKPVKTRDLVVDAFKVLDEPKSRSGHSIIALEKVISKQHPNIDMKKRRLLIKNFMKKGLESGEIKQITGNSLTGSFKLISTTKITKKVKKDQNVEKSPETKLKLKRKPIIKSGEIKVKMDEKKITGKVKVAKAKETMEKEKVTKGKVATKKASTAKEKAAKSKTEKTKVAKVVKNTQKLKETTKKVTVIAEQEEDGDSSGEDGSQDYKEQKEKEHNDSHSDAASKYDVDETEEEYEEEESEEEAQEENHDEVHESQEETDMENDTGTGSDQSVEHTPDIVNNNKIIAKTHVNESRLVKKRENRV